MTVYDKGDNAVLTVTFKNAAGVPVDPPVVKFRAVSPAGGVTNWTYGVDPQVTRTGVGAYSATLPLLTSGLWSYYWTDGAGTVEDSVLEVTGLATERTPAEQKARSWLVKNVRPELDPVLTDADIDDLLEKARGTDAAGRNPSDPGYVPTWPPGKLNAAARDGWVMKRAMIATNATDYGGDGEYFKLSQQLVGIEGMIRRFSCSSGSVTLSSLVT